MTIAQANALLDTAPVGEIPSRINHGITQAKAVEIIRQAVNAGGRSLISDGINLDEILEKRVYQVVRNQKRPRY